MKRLIFLAALFISIGLQAQLDTINTGSYPGAGDGDKGNVAFEKVNRAIITVDSNTNFRNNPSTGIVAGDNLSWNGDTLNATGSGAAWGTITGTLSNQTDLQNALNSKQNTITNSDDISEGSTNLFLTTTERTNIGTSNTHTTSNGSDHTYVDQSVVSGATPTFTNTNFTEATDKNYVTDAEAVVIGNTSGTNTGDQIISDATITTTDITTNDVSTTKHGFAPKGDGSATSYLNGLGAYTTPAGGGDVSFTDTTGASKSIATNHDIDTIQESIDDLQAQLNDTATFTLNAIFGIGSGQTSDTAIFNVDAYCGSFRNWTGDTITIDSINAVLLGTTPDIDIQFFISTSITDGSADELRTTDFNITSITTGDSFTSFNGTTDVLPEQRIWCKVTAVATKPTYLEITVAYSPK
jgi:hypothetical protein